MGRQHFETPEQRLIEDQIAAFVAERWHCEQRRMSEHNYGIDRQFLRNGRHVAFGEVKDRPRLSWGFGEGYFIGLAKVMRAHALWRAAKLPCMLLVRCAHGEIGAADFTAIDADRLVLHGPQPPRDAEDLEPCRVMPWSAFVALGVLPRVEAAA